MSEPQNQPYPKDFTAYKMRIIDSVTDSDQVTDKAYVDAHSGITSDKNGFEDRTKSTLTFTDGSRTLSIQPTATSFDYYCGGTKYTSTGATFQIADTEGIHAIYFDGASLAETVNPTTAQVTSLITGDYSLVSILYWDATAGTKKAIYVGEERHGDSMSPYTHNHLHFTLGMVYWDGLGLNTMSVDGTGVTADAQFGVDSGLVADEDITISISAVSNTTGLPIYYMDGATPNWRRTIKAGFSMRTQDNTSSTRLAYNQYTLGAWRLTEVTDADFVLYHIFATTEKDTPMISVMGQNIYTTKRRARIGAKAEIYSLVTDEILFPEIRPIATIICQTKSTYANAVNCRIVTTADGDNYIDWRNEEISRVSVSTSDHNSLTGLQGGTIGEYFHLTEANQYPLQDLVDDTSPQLGADLDLNEKSINIGIEPSIDHEYIGNFTDKFTVGEAAVFGELFTFKPEDTYDDWAVSTAYNLGDFVTPTTTNGYAYECTTAGTSHAATEPTWPTTPGDTVSDNTATWTCRDLSLFKTDADAEDTSKGMLFISGRDISKDARGEMILPNSFVRDDTWDWTPGVKLYVSTVTGGITETEPSGSGDVIRIIGYATHKDRLYFNPDNYYEVVP